MYSGVFNRGFFLSYSKPQVNRDEELYHLMMLIIPKYHLVCVLPKPTFKRRPQPYGNISNVLNREFHATKSFQKLGLDITSIKVKVPYPKCAYLGEVKELYIHEVVVYDMIPTQNMRQVFRVLHQVSKLSLADQAILQTDQGVIQSMSRRGNCWDNACIENFFHHLKVEKPYFEISET